MSAAGITAGSMSRRGSTLIAVLVTVSIALMVTTSLLFVSQAELAGRTVASEAAHARALSASGLHVLMHELDEQRDRILTGRTPEIDEQYELYERDGRLGVVRVLPIGPRRELIAPEAARIDLNHVDDPERLAATELLDLGQAQDILDYREQRLGGRFQSVGELLSVPGVTPEMVYGPLDEIRVMDDTRRRIEDLGERMATRFEDQQVRGLADVFTVYAVEPPLQRSGVNRINLNVEWSEELGERIEERFGADGRQVLQNLMADGMAFENDGAIYEALTNLGVPVENWPDIIDAIRTSDKPYAFGRLDINTAPQEALRSLPGLEPDQAAEIVRTREQLSEEELETIAWPAIHEIVEPAQYVELGPMLTTRSWTYRLRIAAGTVPADDPEDVLSNPVIYEVVFDLADPTPRIAYIRDVTLLQTAATLAWHSDRADGRRAFEFDRFSPAADEMADTDPVSEMEIGEPAEAVESIEPEPGESATMDRGDTPDEQSPVPEDPDVTGQSAPGRIGRWIPVR